MAGLIIAIIFAIIGTHLFASEIEAVSHARANADENHPKRSLELGIAGRAVMAIVPVVIMILLYLISKNGVASTIIALILSILIFLFFGYLRLNGFRTIWTWALILGGNNLCAMAKSGYGTGSGSTWFYIWSVITTILFVIMIIMNLGLKFKEAVATEDEDEEFDEDESRPAWNTILFATLVIALIVLAFIGGYAIVLNLIVPLFS